MSSTYARLYVPLVWATKGREPWITLEVAPRLHGMIAGRCVALGCVPVAIGGVEEHVHALVGLKTDVDVARLTRELKAGSSAFMHGEIGVERFGWQEGYARSRCATPSSTPRVATSETNPVTTPTGPRSTTGSAARRRVPAETTIDPVQATPDRSPGPMPGAAIVLLPAGDAPSRGTPACKRVEPMVTNAQR